MRMVNSSIITYIKSSQIGKKIICNRVGIEFLEKLHRVINLMAIKHTFRHSAATATAKP